MANIAITGRCNRACSYCFAMETLEAPSSGTGLMPLDTFIDALDLLERSGISEGRLLGGEPTLHPRFAEMVDMVLARGLRLTVFTGGMVPAAALRVLERISIERVRVLVNVIPPDDATGSAKQEEVFRRLGARVVLGLNIVSPAVQLDFTLELIERHGLAHRVRLGLTHPILNGSNEHLHARHYREVGRRVAEFGVKALEHRVRLSFDCGWVPCMFPDGALELLGLGRDDVGLRCNPILDVLPDASVISCFPLAAHSRERLFKEHDAAWLRSRFSPAQQGDRALMLFRECATCHWRARGDCTGGCLAASMGRLRRTDVSFVVPESMLAAAPGTVG
jgi:MoaA/NifB/PqqE/SkfB family radical SAM enzyme